MKIINNIKITFVSQCHQCLQLTLSGAENSFNWRPAIPVAILLPGLVPVETLQFVSISLQAANPCLLSHNIHLSIVRHFRSGANASGEWRQLPPCQLELMQEVGTGHVFCL